MASPPARQISVTPAHHVVETDGQGWVTRIVDDGGCTLRVELVVEDGTDAVAVIPKLDLDWLDLRVGDIVAVRAL